MLAYMLAIDPVIYVVTGINVQSVFLGGLSSVQFGYYSFAQIQHMYWLLVVSHLCSGLCHVLIHHIPLDGTINLCHKLHAKLTTPLYPILSTTSQSTSPLWFPCFHQKVKNKYVYPLSR